VAVIVLAGVSTVAVAALSGNFRLGRPGPFGAITCSAPRLGGRLVDVTLSDMGGAMMGPGPMMATLQADPGAVRSGKVSFLVRNDGGLVHELLVLPWPADGPGTRRIGRDGKVDESQSLGEASRSCAAGSGAGIAPGATGWVTLDLKPGHYELICNEAWHYSAGMFDTLTVH
jgi:uncharacterized cupredoxin-like copper-binding protein